MKEIDAQLSALAYSMGAFLGDGNLYACHRMKNGRSYLQRVIQFGTMDKDMLDRVCDEFEDFFGKRYAIMPQTLKSGTQFWHLRIYRKEIFEFFSVNTAHRTAIPQQFFSASKEVKTALLCGLMDSDGYISERDKPCKRWCVGFGTTSRIMVEGTAWLLRSLGVKVGKIGEYTKGDYKTMYRITPNVRTFSEAGPFFHIQRKRKTLDRCIAYLSSSETMYTAPVTSGEDIVRLLAKA